MARDHAVLRIDIWNDEDYTELSFGAQWLYERLMSHSTLSYCGVAEWRPGKLAASSSDLTRTTIEAMTTELEAGRYILVDRDTEEVLLRSFVKHDGLMGKWNLAAAVARSWSDVGSKPLKGVIVHELIRLKDKRPEYGKCWQRDDVKKIMARTSIDPTDALALLNECPTETPSIDPPNAPILAPSIDPPNGGALLPTPYSPLPTPNKQKKTTQAPSKLGTRIPDDFALTQNMIDWAKAKGHSHLDLEASVEAFFDYWRGVPGSKGKKLDWEATWRNRVRSESAKPAWAGGTGPATKRTEATHYPSPAEVKAREAAQEAADIAADAAREANK